MTSPLKKPAKTLENIPTLIDRSVFPGMQGGPHMNTIAAKAVAFGEALQPEFCDYAKNIVANAARLAEELQKRGFQLVTGGTSNHLILADINKSFSIDGKTAEISQTSSSTRRRPGTPSPRSSNWMIPPTTRRCGGRTSPSSTSNTRRCRRRLVGDHRGDPLYHGGGG